MNRFLLSISLMAALLSTSCSQEELTVEKVQNAIEEKHEAAEKTFRVSFTDEEGNPLDAGKFQLQFLDAEGKSDTMTTRSYTTSGTGSYAAGSTGSCTATAGSGYYISGFSVSKGTATASHTYTKGTGSWSNLQSDITFKVTDAANSKLTVSAGTGGTAGTTGTGTPGSTKTVTATPSSGYSFVNWTGTGASHLTSTTSASTTYTFQTSSESITANFKSNATYKWTVSMPSACYYTLRNGVPFKKGATTYSAGTVLGEGHWPLSTSSSLSGTATSQIASVTVTVTSGTWVQDSRLFSEASPYLTKAKSAGCPVQKTQTVKLTWTKDSSGNYVGKGSVADGSYEEWVEDWPYAVQ